MRKSRPSAPGPNEVATPKGASGNRPVAGNWVWACREGYEATLKEELEQGGGWARTVMPGLVESAGAPRTMPVFARFGFQVRAVLPDDDGVAAAIATAFMQPVWVQAWVPDSVAGSRFTRRAAALGTAVLKARRERALPVFESAKVAATLSGDLAQVVVLDDGLVLAGVVIGSEGSPHVVGGRTRMRRDRQAPSRAAMKLEEALQANRLAPAKGETCVDLGAAPGGWSERLLKLGARVIAVDPARLRDSLLTQPGIRHAQCSAFQFSPEQPVDWLFCDMAWRPLEVAALIGKWGRRRWAANLVANFKLPMKDKLVTVERVRETLEAAGWADLRIRHLYHDRDEVTVLARLR